MAAEKINNREFKEEELENLPENFEFKPGDILILKEMPYDRFINHSFQHHSGYCVWTEAPCGGFYTFYGYLDGNISKPYYARPFVNAHTITAKPVIVDEAKVPNRFKAQNLF